MTNEADPKKAGGFSGWLTGILAPLVQVAVKEAVADLHGEIKSDMLDMENKLLAQVNQLPGLVASQVENVALDAEQVAEKVAQEFGNFINPGQMAQQVIQGILGGMPHLPNIFGAMHETSPGTTAAPGAQLRPKSKAEQIRQKLDEKKGNA
jgi:hypothetical protein